MDAGAVVVKELPVACLFGAALPPRQEPVTTAEASWSSGVSSRPDWATASRAAMTANCAKRSMKPMSLGVK